MRSPTRCRRKVRPRLLKPKVKDKEKRKEAAEEEEMSAAERKDVTEVFDSDDEHGDPKAKRARVDLGR